MHYNALNCVYRNRDFFLKFCNSRDKRAVDLKKSNHLILYPILMHKYPRHTIKNIGDFFSTDFSSFISQSYNLEK